VLYLLCSLLLSSLQLLQSGYLCMYSSLNHHVFFVLTLQFSLAAAITALRQASTRNSKLRNDMIDQFTSRLIADAPSAVGTLWDQIYWDNSLADGSPSNELKLRRIEHTALATYKTIAASFFGYKSGKVTALVRSAPPTPPLTHVWVNGTVYGHLLNTTTAEPGLQVAVILNQYSYNTVWYKAAMLNQTTAWSAVFTTITTPPVLAIALGRPVYINADSTYDSQIHKTSGNLIGVAGCTFFLEQLSAYLRQVDVEEGGKLFIVERHTGFLIASNAGNVTSVNNGKITRVYGNSSDDDIIAESSQKIESHFGGSMERVTPIKITFVTSNSKRTIIEVSLFKDAYGLDWLVVAALSYKTLYGKIVSANIIAGVFSLVALGCAVALAFLLGLCITRPLTSLSKQLYKVADMDFDEDSKKNSLSNLYEFTKMEVALKRMKEGLNNFRKYVPGDLVRSILRRGELASLGVETKILTVSFCDIVNFTNITENIDPKLLINVMQDFFTQANNVIAATEGTVDKYIGDCVMSFWNSPNNVENHEVKSIQSALDLIDLLKEMNNKWAKHDFPELAVRIGINTASVLVGNVGAPSRMNFTALGDGVNVAARLESLNNFYQTRIMIGESTYANQAVQETFACKWLDNVILKGKDKPVSVYEVMGYMADINNEQAQEILLHNQMRDELAKGKTEEVIRLCGFSKHVAAKILLDRLTTGTELYLKREDK
jgi:class 3 adenylate cyclase